MGNSNTYFHKDENALKSEILELAKRVTVAETQLDVLVSEYKFKKQVWAAIRKEFGNLSWAITCILLALLIIKLHIFR